MSNSKFKKEDIIAILKNVLKEDQIVNINNFNNEVLLDIIPSNIFCGFSQLTEFHPI